MMPKLTSWLVALAVLGTTLVGPAARGDVPADRWAIHDPDSIRRIDHNRWDSFLMRYLRINGAGEHRVAYARVTPADRTKLDDYLAHLGRVEMGRYDRPEQLAFWINLYNALTVRLVLDHYPIASIRDVDLPPQGGPWRAKLIEVEGVPLSLDDIRNRILRPIWQDPRVLYALSCAATGCPNLQPEPFRSDRLGRQLTKAAMAYVNDPRCLNMEGDRLTVSSLYRWYRDDFGGSDAAIIHHLMAYAEPKLAFLLQRFDRVDGDAFDWSLNDAGS